MTRADNRRAIKADAKKADYAESGFRDRSIYTPFVPNQRTGSGHNGAYSSEELHQRAVERRDGRRTLEVAMKAQIKATEEAQAARRQADKTKRRVAYLAAFRKPQPTKYLHSAARRRLESAAPMAIAA